MALERTHAPVDIVFAGMDGIGKGTIALRLNQVLRERGFAAHVIDPPHYSEFQKVPLFRRVTRASKALIEKGVREGRGAMVMAGSVLAAAPLRTAMKITSNADVRIIERHPRIEAHALSRIYSGRRGSTLTKQASKLLRTRLPRVLVFVTGKPAIAAQRIAVDETRRARWSVSFQHETTENLAGLDQAYRRIARSLKRSAGDELELIEVNGERPVEENVKQIISTLEERAIIPPERRRPLVMQIKRLVTDANYQKQLGRETLQKVLDSQLARGNITEQEHAELTKAAGEDYAIDFLRHFGAHVGLTIALQFTGVPGSRSAARAAWVTAFRIKTHRDYRKGRLSEEEFRRAKALHSGVAAFVSLTPVGIGATAYPVSAAIAHARGVKLIDPRLPTLVLRELQEKIKETASKVARGLKRR